ncbi:hypothetical protein [Isoptericola sp. BMS4]|uniref:hypothetical protein n=1 Tax=Isoptericola sp. BMS4 TaxID=2527875 RepID=UPI0014245A98|nr:hypothetical protein [Isoptericola sp. BMS4]
MSTRRRRPGETPAGLVFALVAAGGLALWATAIGVLILVRDGDRPVLGLTCVVGGAVVLLAVTLMVVSLLRGPATVVIHTGPGTRWSLRASPVPLRLASSTRLPAGSRGEILAAQVVRAVAQEGARPVDTARAVLLLRRILELGGSTDEAEWARVRVAVVDLMLRASDHPQPPAPLVPWEERCPSPR